MLQISDDSNFTLNLKGSEDLYLNKSFDYTPIIENSTMGLKINKKDTYLSDDLNDFMLLIYIIILKWMILQNLILDENLVSVIMVIYLKNIKLLVL
jgi:hypothetical protein